MGDCRSRPLLRQMRRFAFEVAGLVRVLGPKSHDFGYGRLLCPTLGNAPDDCDNRHIRTDSDRRFSRGVRAGLDLDKCSFCAEIYGEPAAMKRV